MKIFVISGKRIEEVWFKAIKTCVEFGHDYVIDQGEYKGQHRKELDYVTLRIETPWVRPLACQSKTITPTSDEKIEKYFQQYLMDPDFESEAEKRKNEYKYSTWVAPMWENCCRLLLNGKGGCNQATISTTSQIPVIGYGDIDNDKFGPYITQETLVHPPCLRVIDMRIRYGALHFIIYFRSWDLVSGLPENLGGIQLLKEWCLGYINSSLVERNEEPLKDGEIIASSKGLHIYDHFWKMAEEYACSSESSALDLPGIFVI